MADFEDFEEVMADQSDESSGDEAVEPAEEQVEEPAEASEEPEGPPHWEEVLSKDIDWSGIDRAPKEKLPPAVAHLKAAASRELQRAAEERKKWEEAYANLNLQKQSEQPRQEDAAPPWPTADDDDATYQQKMDARMRWNAKQAAGEQPDIEKRLQEFEEARKREQYQAQMEKVESKWDQIRGHQEFTEEIRQQMLLEAEEDPSWGQRALANPSALEKLFVLSKHLVNERKAQAKATDRAATAATRTLPKTSTRKSAPSAGKQPSGETLDEIGRELLQGEFKDLQGLI